MQKLHFRKFDKVDWYAYAGCDTQDPLIADVMIDGQGADIILDGKAIGVFTEEDSLILECFSPEQAMVFASGLPSSMKEDHLVKLGFIKY